MRTLALRSAVVVALVCARLAGAQTSSDKIDAMFSRFHTPDSPGAAVLVQQNGKIVHARGYGMANLEQGVPIRPNTIFDIASVSKQFCAMAIALLEADGRLSLTDDVRKYIPELADFGRTITIDHLIHHTSGLRDWPGTLRIAGWNFEDVMSYDQILRMAFRQRELNFDPGSEYAYSNTGYNMLSLVVQRVSGQSFRRFTDERIFAPLGMTSTHFHDDHDAVVRGRAESYRPGANGTVMYVPNNLTALGSSSLFTTVEDLARWVRNFEQPIVGNAQLVARLHTRGVLNKGDTIPYAFGQNVDRYRGLTRVSHTGSWAGNRTTLVRFPAQQFSVIILANVATINPTAIANSIVDLYLADKLGPVVTAAVVPPAPPVERWTPAPAALRELSGRYDSDELDTFWTVSERNGKLIASHFRVGDTELLPVSRDVFRAPLFGELRFLRDAKGRVTAFTANADRVRNLRFARAGKR
jgi:CubicO group peptidase (beta-lactamase class C family)